jgi:hypothetical protein
MICIAATAVIGGAAVIVLWPRASLVGTFLFIGGLVLIGILLAPVIHPR